MIRLSVPAAILASSILALGPTGCNSTAPAPTSQSATGQAIADHAEHTGHSDHDHAHAGNDSHSAMDTMKTELAKLSPEDAASAERQHVCPVSGEMLGTMGAPQKVEVNGQQVWICCNGCKDKLLGQPDKYLANLQME